MSPSSQNSNKKNESEDSNVKDTLDPSQRDAKMVRHRYPISWLLRLLTALMLLLTLVFLAIAYMMGTDDGTKFMIEKIINQTGVSLEYGKGNLRDGLSVSNIYWSGETTTIKVDKGYVKIGWRAVLDEEFHLRDADISNILISDSEVSSGDSFSYNDISLPYNIRLNHAKINSIVYKKSGLTDLVFKNIDANNLQWKGTKLTIGNGDLSYSDIVDVKGLQGNIDFTDDYPLDADANVTIMGLDEAYFGSIDLEASGSLKQTHGTIKSVYNNKYKVTGELDAQPLIEGVPFSAVVKWQKAKLPYATQHDIWLKSSVVKIDGTYSDINLTVDSKLEAKGIPTGEYHAETRVDIFDGELHVDKLTAKNKKGQLTANGLFNWKDDFFMDVSVHSSDYDLAGIIPKQYDGYSQYQGYLPENLNGFIDFNLQNKNEQGNFHIDTKLSQTGAETVQAAITELNTHDNTPNPWQITANWQNYYRKIKPNLDEHLIGIIDSEAGNADMLITEDKLEASVNAKVNQISVAPKGEYQLELNFIDSTIDITSLAYQGVVGGFSGEAQVVLPEKDKSLTWQVDGIADNIKLSVYNESIPIEHLNGKLIADGIVDFEERKQELLKQNQNIQIHQINVKQSDFIMLMTDEYDKRDISVKGDGGVVFNLDTDSLILQDDFQANFEGLLKTADMPEGEFQILVNGKPDKEGNIYDFDFEKLNYSGDQGHLSATGKLGFQKAITWDLQADLQKFNMGFFVPDNPAIVTGKLNTNGEYFPEVISVKPTNADKNTHSDTLKTKNSRSKQTIKPAYLDEFSVKFNGEVETEKLPSGKIIIDASGSSTDNRNTEIIVNQFKHQSDAGSINAKGKLNLNSDINNSINSGLQWQIDTHMNNFNLGYFLKDVPSNISGNLNTTGTWNDKQQLIDVKDINLKGKLKEKELTAKGQVLAKLRLPNDINHFLQSINSSKPNEAYQQANKLIDKLKIQDFVVKWGDNYLTVNGDKQNLQTQVNITDLDKLSQSLKGEVTGGINLKSADQNKLPTVYVDLIAKQIDLPDIQLSDGRIQGKIVDLGEKSSLLTLTAKKLTVSNQDFEKIDLLFKGTESSHKLKLSFDNNDIGVSAVLEGGFRGSNTGTSSTDTSITKLDTQKNNKSDKWQGLLVSGKVKTDDIELFQLQPAQMIFDVNNASLNLASHCWQADKARSEKSKKVDKDNQSKLCLKDNLVVSQETGNIDISLQQIDTSLITAVMPKEIDWKAQINGKAKINWQQGSTPNISGTLFTDNGKIGMIQEDESRTYIPYRRISLIALTTPQGLKVRTDIKSEGKSQGYADLTIDPYLEGKPIKGDLVLNQLNLAMFKPFFPGMRVLEGEGSMTAKIEGKLQKPLIYGSLKFQNGRMSMLGLPINLSKVNATAKIAGTHAKLEGSFNSGSGKGKMSGTLDWQGDIQTKLSITGEQLEVAQPPLISAKISPDINIIVKPKQNYMKITGAVSIPSATFRPPEANEDIVTKSSDVDILDRRTVDNIDEVLAISEPWSINANIGVDLGKNVKFRGFGTELPMAGAIVITQQGHSDMQAKGVIQVSRSSNVDVFGQSLELKYAQIRFNGDLQEPDISINTAKTIDNTTVGLRVKGSSVDPKIIVYNDSGLSEQQAMNALVTGRLTNKSANQVSEEGFRSEITNNLAAAGLSMGLNPIRGWTNQIGRAVGLQSLSLSANASGKTDDTNVNVTGYITPDLYIRYGFGVFNAQSELSFRYQLTRRLYVEATSSTEKFVDLVYGWQF